MMNFRNPNKKLSHDARRAKQRAKRQGLNREEMLKMRRGDDGEGITDMTPCIAVLNIITNGKYLKAGKGFPIKAKTKEIKEVAHE